MISFEIVCINTLCGKHIFPPGVSVCSPEAGSRGTTAGVLIFREGKHCWTSGTRSLTPLTFCSHTALLWVSHSSHTHTRMQVHTSSRLSPASLFPLKHTN